MAYQNVIIKLVKEVNQINYSIITRQINSISQVKRHFLFLKNEVEKSIGQNEEITINGVKKKLLTEVKEELEKLYTVSLKIFRSYFWGEFSRLNKKHYPELYQMMLDKNGDLLRIHDDFKGTIAMLDFHGYTKFSSDVKYNKTPLMEFGEKMPKKIMNICQKCNSLVYEIEGDSLIVIGPENPHYVMTAVLFIIELVRQKKINKDSDSREFHGIEIKNAMIKKFEMNAAVTTGGETFINNKGNLIGGIIAEASRILKIVNLKKPLKSGIIISDKVYRNLDKFKESNALASKVNIFDFPISSPFLVDVKGMRLKIREVFLEKTPYYKPVNNLLDALAKQISLKNSSKWFNIVITFAKINISILRNINISVQYNNEEYNGKKLALLLEENIAFWAKNPFPDYIREIIKITNLVYQHSSEIRDVTAIYHDYVNENFTYIIERLEGFYDIILKGEKEKSRTLKNLITSYNQEMEKIRDRFFPRRIFETILTKEANLNHLIDIPYIGKV